MRWVQIVSGSGLTLIEPRPQPTSPAPDIKFSLLVLLLRGAVAIKVWPWPACVRALCEGWAVVPTHVADALGHHCWQQYQWLWKQRQPQQKKAWNTGQWNLLCPPRGFGFWFLAVKCQFGPVTKIYCVRAW